MFGLSCRAHCHRLVSDLVAVVCSDGVGLYIQLLRVPSPDMVLTWYRPVSARSEQCGTEADMRAGAAHKRDVLPHSISGLRSIRWLAPWAPARAVVIGWAQRLGARWHSGRQLLGSEAEQNEYNRNIIL